MNADTPVTHAELKSELAVLKTELKSELADSEKRIIEYMDERTRDLQTELLRAFVEYSNSVTFQ
jgi:hypothetical protein